MVVAVRERMVVVTLVINNESEGEHACVKFLPKLAGLETEFRTGGVGGNLLVGLQVSGAVLSDWSVWSSRQAKHET